MHHWRILRACLCALSALLLLSSCGGGGGDTGSSYSISFSTSSLTFDYLEGDNALSQRVTAQDHGEQPDSGVYAGITVTGTGIQQSIPLYVNENEGSAYADIVPLYGLAPGDYSGVIRFLVCADELCKNHIKGSPHDVSYTIHVHPRLRATPTAMGFTVKEQQFGAPQTVQVVLPDGVSAVTTSVNYTSGSGWLQVQNNGASLTVTPSGIGLSPGVYGATLWLRTNQGQAQEFAVPVSMTVVYDSQEHLSANLVSLSFKGGEEQVLATQALTLNLPRTASATTSVAYTGGAGGWLQVQNNGRTLGLTASTKGLVPGVYKASLTIDDGTETLSVPMELTVAYDALKHLFGNLDVMAFSGVETQAVPAQTMTLNLPRTTTATPSVNYAAGASGWLNIQNKGTSLVISANGAGLSPGAYTASLTVSDGTESFTVPVSFALNRGLLPLPSETITILSDSPGTGQFPLLTATGISPGRWTAASNQPWLVLDSASGAIGDDVHWHVDPARFGELANNASYTAQISLGGAGLSSVIKQITLSKRFAEITHVDTLALLAGESGDVLLYGKGFAGLSGFAGRVQLGGGLTAENITVMGDSVARLTVRNVPAGTYSIMLGTRMGAPTHSNSLRVLERQTYAYMAVDTEGNKGSLVWDPVSKSAFAVDKSLSRIHRFGWNGSTFVDTAMPVGSPFKLAMDRDHQSLVLLTSDGQLKHFNPLTLAELSSRSIGTGGSGNTTQLPLVIDGINRLWLGSWSYDLDSDTSQYYTVDYQGRENSAISANGRRLLVGANGTYSPQPPLAMRDLASEQFATLSGGPDRFFYQAASNRTGTRWILHGGYALYDNDMLKLGNLTLPDTSWYPVGAVLSRDGMRAYVLTIHDGAISLDYNTVRESTTPDRPRIYVFNTGSLSASQTEFPLVGSFDVPDYAGCRTFYNDNCSFAMQMVLSDDDRTLFLAGARKFIAVPVAARYLPPSDPDAVTTPVAIMGVQGGVSGAEMKRWRRRH